jgi:hypothetical protein
MTLEKLKPGRPARPESQLNKSKMFYELKAWKDANPEKARDYWKTPKAREARARYYRSERGQEVARRSQEKNREKRYARNALRRQTPEYKAWQKNYSESYYKIPTKRIHKLLLGARVRAGKDGLDFDSRLFAELESAPPDNCPSCGIRLTYDITKYCQQNPSIDRIDNAKGYIVGNSCVICWRCNMLKRHGSIQDFENLIRYMKSRLVAC